MNSIDESFPAPEERLAQFQTLRERLGKAKHEYEFRHGGKRDWLDAWIIEEKGAKTKIVFNPIFKRRGQFRLNQGMEYRLTLTRAQRAERLRTKENASD